MKRTSIALALSALAMAGWPTTQLIAQETKMARGTVTALAGDSVTVKVGTQEMKFTVDSKTHVEATGGRDGGTAGPGGRPGGSEADRRRQGGPGGRRQLHRNGRNAPCVQDPGGDQRRQLGRRSGERDENGDRHGEIGRPHVADHLWQQRRRSDVHADLHNRRDPKVVGRGAGTAAAAAGGKTVVTDLVGNGDHVSVSYHTTGNTLHAAEIRVTSKAAPPK